MAKLEVQRNKKHDFAVLAGFEYGQNHRVELECCHAIREKFAAMKPQVWSMVFLYLYPKTRDA